MRGLAYVLIISCLACFDGGAATHFVVMPGTAGVNPEDPYTNWATAGTNIIDVVNAAMTNAATRLIWVTNGTYYPTNTINVSQSVTLQSVNGRDVTILNGRDNITNRGLYFTAASSTLDGFTITNHVISSFGAGVRADSAINVINCLITGNRSTNSYGGGCYLNGASAISNCIIRGNIAYSYGGGIHHVGSGLRMDGCLIEDNSIDLVSTHADRYGGGFYMTSSEHVTVTNCQFVNNRANRGAAIATYVGTANDIMVANCTIRSNQTASHGAIYVLNPVNIVNCTISDNVATNADSVGGGFSGGTLRNCLVVRNRCNNKGGGYYGAGNIGSSTIASNCAGYGGGGGICFAGGMGTNNIIYHNTASVAPNYTNNAGVVGLDYSCVFPAVAGTGNITNDPGMIDLNGGNYQLALGSLCINTGTNEGWMTNVVDLDGHRRVDRLSGRVDMGAYEFIHKITLISGY